MNQTGNEFILGRIEFGTGLAPVDPTDPLRRMPGYTVETPPQFKRFAEAIGFPTVCWLIEVSFDGDSRAPRYFTGECEAGWVGCTTIRADIAQKYSSKELAEQDIAKLAPRLIGKWVAREHGFS